jgi:peptidoglycan/xylan/chitin deacetylase (PgdA/CDA1 family)/glycosyltransferase involved in cell wall biosynthesis
MNYLNGGLETADVGIIHYFKARLKAVLAWGVHHSGVFLPMRWMHRRLFGPGVRILFCHRVENSARPDALGSRPLTATEFDRQLRHLVRFWHVVSLEEAVRALESGAPLPTNTVVITFDDGYRDNYTVALPLLEKYKLPATIFVVSGALDGKPLWFDEVHGWFAESKIPSLRFSQIESELSLRTPAQRGEAARKVVAVLKTLGSSSRDQAMAELRARLGVTSPNRQPEDRAVLTWDELRRMATSKLVTVGAHTVTHPILTHLDRENVRCEIEESSQRIAQELQRPVHYFAYPNGAYNATAQGVVRQAGLVACESKGGGFNPADSDLTALRRLGAEGLSLSQFALYLAGWEDLREGFRRRFRQFLCELKRIAYVVLELSGFYALLRYLNSERLTVLLYHGVSNGDPAAHLDNLHVPAESFRRQMRWLRKKFTPISLEQALAAMEVGQQLPPNPVLVTFDDAYRNNVEVAGPILKEFKIPITIFVPTDFIEHRRSYWVEELEGLIISTTTLALPWGEELLWLRSLAERRAAFSKISKGLSGLKPTERELVWEEIKRQLSSQGINPPFIEPRLTWEELRLVQQEGVSIGSHTVSHAILPGLPADQVISELQGSKRELELRLGTPVLALAYPNGSWDPEVRLLTEEAGYACAFTGQPGTNGRDVDRFLLNRIGINAADTFSEFVSAVSGFSRLGSKPAAKILEVGNYPPPQCGWAMQMKLLTEELRRRGATCEVMNINESRKVKSPEYVDVQSGLDYLLKLLAFALRGYCPHTHVNAESTKGYLLALAANLAGRAAGRPAAMTFHGGVPQSYFPRPDSSLLRLAYRLLFLSAGSITCDSIEIERAIKSYGINGTPIASIPCFSLQNLDHEKRPLPEAVEAFLAERGPVFFCFLCFRPEYAIDTVLAGMRQFQKLRPRAGFIWLGFPAKERSPLEACLDAQPGGRPENLLLLGNLEHDTFMTLLSRCFAYLRPHSRDGVSASVLESLAINVPVIAAENGMRPPGVVTYHWNDADDLCSKLAYVVENYEAVKHTIRPLGIEDNISRVAKWLLQRKGVDNSIHAYSGQS